MHTKSVIVFGGLGPLGSEIALALTRQGYAVTAAYRNKRENLTRRLVDEGVALRRVDLQDQAELSAALKDVYAAVFTPILTVSAGAAAAAAHHGVERAVLFSSNNVAVDPLSPIYRDIARREQDVLAILPRAAIVRPTLIYGHAELPALERLCALMRQTPIMPIPGQALQQPVFYRDLALLAAGLLEEGTKGGIYAAGGPEIMTTAALYRAVSCAVGGLRLLVPAPAWSVAVAAAIARILGLRFPLDPHQVERIDLDRVVAPQLDIPPRLAPRTPFAEGLRWLLESRT